MTRLLSERPSLVRQSEKPISDVFSPPPQNYLEIRNVWKAFGDFLALRDISLDVYKGEFVCFLGPSGCGKTTLLRAIAGLDPQSRGIIRQDGRDISAEPASRRDYGIVFQSYALFPNLTVAKNVAFGLENAGHRRADVQARVAELLELVGLPEQASKYPAQLSGGQQQRIALARAIAIKPGLLLLDEPLSALDAKVRVHLRHEVKELQRKLGVTTVMVTHDQEEALSMADRVVVMNQGIIEQVGTPSEIYRSPTTLFVADFIGETNKIPATYARGRVSFAGLHLDTVARHVKEGARVTVALRPEDIMPQSDDEPAEGEAVNRVEVVIGRMEFLGSHWRAHLTGASLGDIPLIANFSMGATRRFDLAVGNRLTVEIPAERVLVFDPEQAS